MVLQKACFFFSVFCLFKIEIKIKYLFIKSRYPCRVESVESCLLHYFLLVSLFSCGFVRLVIISCDFFLKAGSFFFVCQELGLRIIFFCFLWVYLFWLDGVPQMTVSMQFLSDPSWFPREREMLGSWGFMLLEEDQEGSKGWPSFGCIPLGRPTLLMVQSFVN